MRRLGDLLTSRRAPLDLRLRQMEERTGLSEAYLCKLETGQMKNPSVLKALALADGYEVPVSDLLDAAGRDAGWRPRAGRHSGGHSGG